jgi:sorting nexin-41/42
MGIETIGEALDTTVTITARLSSSLQESTLDLLEEYEKMGTAIDTILKWRHARHVEYESVTEGLVTLKMGLGKLEASEAESQRLAAVLNAEGTSGARAAYVSAAGAATQVAASTVPQRSGVGVGSTVGGGGLFATLNSLMDNDPEATRRSNISKTKDKILSMESEREASLGALGMYNEAIQKDLDRFQKEKMVDFRNMLLRYAVAQRDACRKGVEAWESAEEQIERMETSRISGVPGSCGV